MVVTFSTWKKCVPFFVRVRRKLGDDGKWHGHSIYLGILHYSNRSVNDANDNNKMLDKSTCFSFYESYKKQNN